MSTKGLPENFCRSFPKADLPKPICGIAASKFRGILLEAISQRHYKVASVILTLLITRDATESKSCMLLPNSVRVTSVDYRAEERNEQPDMKET